jgi:HlyD family secretion protein
MIVRSIVIPTLAVAGVALATYTAVSSNQPVVPAQPVAAPAVSPFATQVAGAGIVEASTQNIALGTNVPGIVTRVMVKVGDEVKAGTPLFAIDDRSLSAELAVRRAELASRRAVLAEAELALARLRASPRAEDVPPVAARVAEAESLLADARTQLDNAEAARAIAGAISKEEFDRRRWGVQTAQARLATARAELARVQAGAWSQDVSVAQGVAASAQAGVEAAQAGVQAVQTELERLTVKAPVDGQVLQVNVRAGEYAPGGVLATPLMLFGQTDLLHVRVDVDENDAWRVRPGAKARASLRGNAELATDVQFVRIEPYVVPKRSLTGDSSERVDTRVLQVLYSFQRGKLPVYVGQQMDVFIEASRADADRSGVDASKG